MTRDFNEETRIARNPDTVWRKFDREIAIIVPTSAAVRTLNEVAARVWELADGRSFRDIVDELVNEFDVSRTELEADIRGFLADLDARDLLERSQP